MSAAASSPSAANGHLPSSPSVSASISESSPAVSPSRYGTSGGSLSAGTGNASRVASVHYHARTASTTSYATAPSGTVRSHVVRRSSGRSASNVSTAMSTTNGATAGSVSTSDNRVSFVASPDSGGNPGLNTIHSFASVNGTRQGSFVGTLPMVASGPFPHLILPEVEQGAELPMPKELENVRTNYCEKLPEPVPSIPSHDYLELIDLGPLVREPMIVPAQLGEWDPAARAVMDSLAKPRSLIRPKAAHLADYMPLYNSPGSASPSSSSPSGNGGPSSPRSAEIAPTNLLSLCQDALWSNRSVPHHRRRHLAPSHPPPRAYDGGWLELSLAECSFPDIKHPVFLQLSLHEESSGAKISSTVHMERNSAANTALLSPTRGTNSPPVDSPTALFPLALVNRPGVVLVVRVDRVLDKPGTEMGAVATAKLATYRQPWAAAIVHTGDVGDGDVAVRSVSVRKPNQGQSLAAFITMLAHASNMGSQSSVSTGSGSPGSNSPTPKSIGCCIRFNVKRHATGGPLGLSPSAALARPGAKAPSATGYEFANEFGNEGASAVVDGCEPGGPVQHTMYVQPVQLLQRRGKGRNMTCSVEVCANATGEPMPCISGRACEVEWKTRAFTNVVYHEKSPLLDDEVKCRLMPTGDKLHLRFTFYHVSCKEKQPASLTSGGHTYISLTDTNGKFLTSGEYTLPIFTNEISGTSYLDTDPATALDNAKDTFTVSIQIKSTLALQDEPLHTFLRTPLESSDPALVLQSASSELIRFHIPITDRLFSILSSSAPASSAPPSSRPSSPIPGAHIHEQAVCGLIHLYNVLHAEQHSGPNGTGPISLLSDFVYHRLLPADAHVALMDAWACILDHAAAAQAAPSPNQWAELGLDVAWAMFDSIVKSMALMRKKSKRGAPGGEQMDVEVASVRKLVTVVSTLVHKKALNGLTLAKDLNTSLGYFLRDLIPLLPLDFVLSLTMFHSDPIKLTDSATLATLKFDFLAIIAGSEHPIPLDYIFTQTIHFIRHSVSDVRLLAASLLRDICAVRELTSGVTTPMHLYLADSILGFLPHLTRPVGTTDTLLLRTLALCALHSMERVVSDKHLEPWVSDVLDVQGWMQRVLICLHTFQYASMDAVVDRLYLVQHRNQVGGAKKFLEDYFKSTGSAAAAMARGKGNRSSAVTTATFPSMVQHTQGADTTSQVSKVDDRSVAAELYLSHQVVLRTLKVWDMLYAQFESRELGGLLEFLLQATWVPMGDEGMVPVLTRIIKVVEKDPTTVLDRYLSPLVASLLRKAASHVPPVRMAAGQVLFATFRACYKLQQKYLEVPLVGMTPGQAKLRRAFVTFRIHFTVAISQFNEGGLDHIATCLDEISKRCEHVDDKQFRELMRQSSLLLSEVIRNQLKLATIPDFETRMDCYQAIGNRYHNTPDLRLCTLDIMGSLYAESGHPVESGLSYLHAAALIAEHVTVQTPTYPGPKGVPAFSACNSNLGEERIADETVRRGLGEGMCSSDLFSEDGLLQYLTKAVTQLTKSSLYETVNEVYKLSIPIWEHRRDWPALAAAHQALSEAFSVLHNKPNRMLATYYRVGFLGVLWGPELAGSQYIYRERGVCVLPEFVSKLKSSFAGFGDKFEVLQDSSKIDESKLDPAKRYVQVTHVEPYYGDTKRYPTGPPASIFDQHQHLRTFLYMVPFTLTSGRVHGDVASQYLRQVVCTTEKSFPYMTKRLRVTHVAETELNPLQVSTQALNARCARLRQLVHAVPTDTKSLQMVLSGSLRPQVNSGPSEIARVFLTPSTAPGQSAPVCAYPASELDELRSAFRQFLRLCEVGVTLNRQLISSDQVGYQEDLEMGMRDLTEILTPMIQQTVARPRQPTAEVAGQGGAPIKSIMEFLGSQGDLTSFFLD